MQRTMDAVTVIVQPPAIIRLFGDFWRFANFGHLLALTEFSIGFKEFDNDLIHCVAFLMNA